MTFPDESERMLEISTRLAPIFATSNALLDHCVQMITFYRGGISRDKINAEPVRFRSSHAICIKACKSFRASIALAGIGSAEELNVVSRTMFETFVALNFVLKERLKISNSIGEVAPELRAKLYVAHGILKMHDKLLELKASRSTSQPIPNESVIQSEADLATADIGEEWANRLRRRPRTYSSLSLRDLISRFDEPIFDHWYNFIYSSQSQNVHAADPLAHVKFEGSESRCVADWFAPTASIGLSLATNGLLLGGCLIQLHEYCVFETEVHAKLAKLVNRLEQLTSTSI